MKSFNLAVLGDFSIADQLGKAGSKSDITFYEKKTPDSISCFIVPSGFPDKIQPLIQTIALSEYIILNPAKIDKALGEQIVALDNMKIERGFIISSWLDDELMKLIRSTVLERYEFVTLEELRQKIESLPEVSQNGQTKVLVDASFEVKGAGTVVLGVVRRGTVKQHDELEVFPQKKSISVRSIQMHDDDVESAPSPARVGLSIKGLTAKEINRGDALAAQNSLQVSNELKVGFEKSRFYKGEINASWTYHLCIGLQIKPVKIKVDNGMTITAEKPIAYEPQESCAILDLNSTSTRIMGNGTVIG
ncbi:MAG: elongation factor Tu [Thaumarchaeota archaeon]|nr:elongation factor Tu [Nitrososphaerota archaeon]